MRYLRLRETYAIDTSSPYIPPKPVDIWLTNDTFTATNNFYGLQLGVRGRYDSGNWFAYGVAKVALGSMHEAVDVSGSLVTDDYSGTPGRTQAFAGGYFALPTNIGSYSRNEFAAVPEVALSLGYRVTPSLSLFVGYSALYASTVVRPGEQVNRSINTTQSVSWSGETNPTRKGPAQPTFNFNSTDFWAQGVSAGLAVRF